MTLRMLVQESPPSGSYVEYDLVANCVTVQSLEVSSQGPTMLRFTISAPQHTQPIPRYAFIVLWDDEGVLPDSTDQDGDHPLFEGFCEEVNGIESNLVAYTAYDASRFAAKKAPVMSAAWVDAGTKATGAVPRAVFNCKIDSDDDYAFGRNNDGTCGEIIATILDDQYQPLLAINASRTVGLNYVWTDELELLETKPQEKIVFESDTVRNAINQVLTRFYPEWRFMFVPGIADNRQFRFWRPDGSPMQTITLNDLTADPKVLSGTIEATTEGRFTAVEIRGPETTVSNLYEWEDGGGSNTLEPIGSGTILETVGAVDIVAYTQWQIVDSGSRRGGKLMPAPVQLTMDAFNIVTYRRPVLQVSFDTGTTWIETNAWIDFVNGIAYWDSPVYMWSSVLSADGSHYHVPDAARLLWANYSDPIIVRKPSTGFEGTAYSVDGLESEYDLYDEALAVGYEYGTPVTSVVRIAQFETLAQSILDERKDTAYIGSVVIDGLDYSFAWLQKRINFTAIDQDGDPLTTGWEAINAWLTNVSYDFENRLTTLSFNSDQMANLGISEELMKSRLKIKALEQRLNFNTSYVYRSFTNFAGAKVNELAGVNVSQSYSYVDPETGSAQ